jgi:cobalt-precorrin 5A hydrolase/precorrin-3B C17-methyltransferase
MNDSSAVYPIFLTLRGAHVVVVGGGKVGQRKIAGLLAAEASIRVISPKVTPELEAWIRAGRVEWIARGYQYGDLAGARLVCAATDDRRVNARVAEDAAALGLLCNVADAPAEGNFHVPAVHREQGCVVAVGTGGADPARAKRLRDRIAAFFTALLDDV